MQVRTQNPRGLDALDVQIIQRVEENPGIKFIEMYHQWFGEMSQDTLRYRMESLHASGKIRAVRMRQFIRCYPVKGPSSEPSYSQ
jgi:predicted transcriptional regulator